MFCFGIGQDFAATQVDLHHIQIWTFNHHKKDYDLILFREASYSILSDTKQQLVVLIHHYESFKIEETNLVLIVLIYYCKSFNIYKTSLVLIVLVNYYESVNIYKKN